MRHASRTNSSLRGTVSGERVSNTLVTYLLLWNNSRKRLLIPDEVEEGNPFSIKAGDPSGPCGSRGAYGISASWCGNGAPRLRRLGGLRGRSPTLGLRHCPDSYGRLQSRIIRNGRKPDDATPCERRRLSGCKVLSLGNKG